MDRWIPIILVVALIFVVFAFLSGQKGFDFTLGLNKNKIADHEEEKGKALKEQVNNDAANYTQSSSSKITSESAASHAKNGSQGGWQW